MALFGELNGSQLKAWRKSIEVFDEAKTFRPSSAFMPNRKAPSKSIPTLPSRSN